MPPEERFVARFAAEPPQDPLPYGRWADTLQGEFMAACLRVDAEGADLGEAGSMKFVWGVPLLRGGTIATAELAGLTVDQCRVTENRFTLIAPDAYRSDYLEIALWDSKAGELARESLYEEDGDDEESEGT